MSGHFPIELASIPHGAILLLRSVLRVGYVERPEAIVLWRHWVGHSLRPGKPSNSPLSWRGGRLDGAEGAVSTVYLPTLSTQ
jgi:hypothetical protein